MDGAPNHERPIRAVPQTAQEHRGQQVGIGSYAAAVTAAERDVQIIAQPGGQRDVPPAPKIAEAYGDKWAVEILKYKTNRK